MDIKDKEILDLKEQIRGILNGISELKERRISQSSIPPSTIKQRHIGEGPRFIRAGLETDLPVSGESTTPGSTAFYFCTDTFKLKIWTGTVWKSTTLS